MGRLASLFSPFWCLDAKGGEVALFRLLPGFAWVGHKHSFRFASYCLCPLLSYLVLFVLELCWLGYELIRMSV